MKDNNLVDEKNYILIQGWMVNKLKLSGNELIIYAIIYGFSQIEGHKFTGSLQYLSDWTNISKQSCISNLKNLINKNLIIKTEKEVNGIKFCEYSSNLNGIQETLTPIKETLINNIDNNIDILNNKLFNSEGKKISKADEILKENIKCIIDYLNDYLGTKYSYTRKDTVKNIKARFKEGYNLDNFYDVIDKKIKEWKGTEFEKYLQPATLFGEKFEKYMNQKVYFKGNCKSSYSSKPTFDNTADYTPPKGVANMTKQEKQNFMDNELAKDENGNLLKF